MFLQDFCGVFEYIIDTKKCKLRKNSQNIYFL